MTPERLQQIEDLYHSALEQESVERAAFIENSCNDDEELRHEVESLLASREEAREFIETPVHEVAARLIADNQKRSMVGQLIDHYEIVELLDAGGMGEVYLARDKTLGRQVALKLLPDYFTREEARVRRFQQEARTASGLNHPNILTIYEISQIGGQHFIVTEFIDGETLRERLNHTSMKLGEAIEIASQVAGALATANEAGIAHRDIKPENIMIRRDGYVKVLDFGLAKLTEHQAAEVDAEGATEVRPKTDPGMVMGTVQYMSPEQARGVSVDARTDIWSLGVVLYEMLAGRAPFEGETPSHVIVSILEKQPLPLTSFLTEVPAELERIVVKALSKNKDERYQTARDLYLDLQSLKQEREVEARLERVLPPPISSAKYVVDGIKSHKRSAVLAAAVIIIVVSSIAYFGYFSTGGEAIDSIAVMPFVNVSGDPNTEYLADGFSDSIINNLSQLPSLKKVSAFNSVLRYKGKQTDPQVVGRELGVRSVLMGRFIQHGDDLSISVELVDVRDNKRLWGEQYNRKLSDLLALQGEISREISERLRLRLTGEERKQLAKHYTENIEAYRAYLQGHYYEQRGTDAGIKKGIEYFEQAIRIDPNYASAYAGLARAYYSHRGNFMQLPEESRQKVESALLKAIEIDSNLAEAHALLGAIRQDQGDWLAAEKELKRAIEVDPNAFGVYWFHARYLTAIGKNDEAVAEAKRWLEVDPLSPSAVATVGFMSLAAHQYDQAIEFFRQAVEMDPTHAPYHTQLARAYMQKGMYEKAIAEFQKAMAIDNSPPGRFAALAYTYAKSGNKAEALKMLAELRERAKHELVAPVNFAIIYTGLGDNDQAFEWLEKTYKDRTGPPYLAIDLMLDSLRSDPKFADFARRKGLAP
jgi:eukaryotic-like serine/threonine-protein kinase